MTTEKLYRSDADHTDRPTTDAPRGGVFGKRSIVASLAGRSHTNVVFRSVGADASAGALGPRDPNGVAATAEVAVDRAAGSAGSALPEDLRARFESSLGTDLSAVRIHTGGASTEATAAVGAKAYASGDDIHFGAGHYDPSSAFGVHLIAHEVAHTVQQSGSTPSRQHKLEVSTAADAAELEADRAADAMVAGAPLSLACQPSGSISRFAPDAHQEATVAGLSCTFSAEEIGAIYASNWERDFSQGHPAIASAAIAWTAVKNNAARNKGDPGSAGGTFQAAVAKVVDADLTEARDESLGKYQTWEHMDAPDSGGARDAADKRWAGASNGVTGYICDSKAHIKDQMVAALDVYRRLNNLGAVGGSIDNWKGATKPKDYQSPNVTQEGSVVTSKFPANFEDPKVAARNPIREAAADQASDMGAPTDPDHKAAQWRLIGQHLGRAMHAFEDFWAHSNWLELAKENLSKQGTAANKELKTGTFGMAAKAHALGHKLLSMASAFQNDFDLLLRVYGRDSASTKLDSKEAKQGRSTIWGGAGSDHDMAHGALKLDSWSTVGEMSDVGTAVNNVEELIGSGKYKMDDFLCNRGWLASLATKGQLLIKQGDENSDGDSHGKIAKDQHEGDKDHGGAMGVAKVANEMAFGPLRAIMDEQDADKALAATQAQLTVIDTLLQAPSPSHPLWWVVAKGGT